MLLVYELQFHPALVHTPVEAKRYRLKVRVLHVEVCQGQPGKDEGLLTNLLGTHLPPSQVKLTFFYRFPNHRLNQSSMVLMIHFTRDKADKTIPSLEESLSEEQRMQQRWLDDKDNDYGGEGNNGDQ